MLSFLHSPALTSITTRYQQRKATEAYVIPLDLEVILGLFKEADREIISIKCVGVVTPPRHPEEEMTFELGVEG